MLLKVRIFVFFTIAVLIPAGHLLAQDTIRHVKDSTSAKQSKSALKSKVVYNAVDSVRFDVSNQKMYLYGQGVVQYENMVLKADYIEFDMSKNIAFSRGKRDTVGKVVLDTAGMPIGDPVFDEGGKSFDAKELTYNFQTKKGKIKDVITKEGEGYIHAKDAKKDSGDVYFIKNGKYTTCDLENPHFYLKATKLKVIPKDKIICGPTYLAIADVPTPLGLPFGVFPNKVGRKSGVLIPAYGESSALGFFLTDGGYYFGISDYFDLALRGDIYSMGSYNVRANTNYVKRYKYNGFVGLKLGQIQFSEKEFPDYRKDKTFWLTWRHVQDQKLNPTSHFSANINAGSNSYQTYLTNNANDYLSNTFSSNVSWVKSWQGSPYNLSVNMAHSQTKRPKLGVDGKPIGMETLVDLTAPEVSLTRTRLYPFQGKDHVGKSNVFQKIGISPSMRAQNHITTYDSLLFKPDALRKMRNGLAASAPISTSMNLGPIIITPSANVNGYGYFQSYRKHFNADSNKVFTDTLRRFESAYDFSTALSFSTKLYGMFTFKNAKVKGIRHVVTPSASYSYRPDYGEHRFGYYDSVQTDTLVKNKTLYSHYENSVYGFPAAGKSGFLNFSLSNNLEMKLRPSKKDTSGQDRKIVLIESFGVSTSCNLAAKTFNWSNINLFARTRLFKLVDVNLTGIIDPYAYDTSLGRRIERFQYNVNGNIGKLTSANLSLNTSLRSLVKKNDPKAKTPSTRRMNNYPDELAYIQSHPDYYVDFNVPWDLSVAYSLNYSHLYVVKHLVDTVIQSLSFNGSLMVTTKWKVGFRSGFDFVKKDFTYTSFDVYRDLHCWEMRLNWVPFGFRKSYMLTIAVKASALQDLKLNRKRDWYDNN